MIETQNFIACDVRSAQTVMLNMLKVIDSICKRHSIKYWLESGTLLGCRRHAGFIPWDDDLDIGMLKDDYEKFVRIIHAELPPYLMFQTQKTDPRYHKRIPKIRHLYTKMVEDDEKENEPYCQGIFIDIFVFDFVSPFELVIREMLANLIKIKGKKRLFAKGTISRYLFNLSCLPVQLSYTLLKLVLKLIHTGKVSKVIGTLPSYTTYRSNHHVDNVFPLKTGNFEGSDFPIFFDADSELRNIFGNWQQIPPKSNQKSHAKRIYIEKSFLKRFS